MRPRPSILLLLASAASACDRPLHIDPDSCYDITIAAWPDTADYGGDSLEVAPPPRVRLEGARLPGDTTPATIAKLPGVLPSVHSHATWRYVGPDSVMMIWSTGYGLVSLRVGGTAERLTGMAESWFDYRDGHTTSAVAARVDCAAPVPEHARANRRFHLRVPLASGDTLMVGRAVPPSLDLDTSSTGRVVVRDAPVGVFRGALSVRVDTVNATVANIFIDYPDSVRVTELAARIETLLGPPTGMSSGRSTRGDPYEIAGWVDRYCCPHMGP